MDDLELMTEPTRRPSFKGLSTGERLQHTAHRLRLRVSTLERQLALCADAEKQIAALESELLLANAQIEELRDALAKGKKEDPLVLAKFARMGLTPMEGRLGSLLLHYPTLRESTAISELYGRRAKDWPGPNVITVFVSKLRAKLKPHGIEIEKIRNAGYYMSPSHKERLESILGGLE